MNDETKELPPAERPGGSNGPENLRVNHSTLAPAEFAATIKGAGLGRLPAVEADGALHRFHVEGDRPGSLNGWYVLHLDGIPAGAFGSWKTGAAGAWCQQRAHPTSHQERWRITEAVAKAKHHRADVLRQQHGDAAARAQRLWDSADTALFHPYLEKKRVLPLGVRQKGGLLVISMRDIDGRLWTCQTIGADGQKMFLKGGRTRGCFYLIGGPITDSVVVCEGFATASTLHTSFECTRHKPVAAAFSANNLKPVAEAIASRYPGARLTICADNDAKTPGNPGLRAGREAAAVVGGTLAYPRFEDEPFDGTDFNDFYVGGRHGR